MPEESIHALYSKHGESFVSKLDGLFLLIYKPINEERVYFVNNRQEATRLYYYFEKDVFYFSIKLEELLNHFPVNPRANFGSVRSFLANGFTISEKTQIEGIKKLLPTDYFVVDENGKIPEIRNYWKDTFRINRRPFENLELKVDQYELIYQNGIQRILEAGKKPRVGCLLSGGHDTSFLISQIRKILKSDLHTYTVVFPDWAFDEGKLAENVAKKFQCIHHPVEFTAKDLDEIIPLIKGVEEPVVGSSLALHVLAKHAAGHVDVVFGGDGGDTLWGEYYPVEEYHRFVRHLPVQFRKGIHHFTKTLRDLFDWERFWELEHVAGLFAEENYHENFLRKLCTYRHFDDGYQRQILRSELSKSPYNPSHNQIQFTDENFGDALIEGKLLNGFYTYQGHHTTKLFEAQNLRFYMPTTQTDVISFICGLPKEWINGGNFFQRLTNNKSINRKFHKHALRRSFSPEEIYNRSFDMPWFQIIKPRKELLKILLSCLEKRGWFQMDEVRKLIEHFGHQKVKEHELLELKNHGYRVFTLLSLEVWCQIFLDRKTTYSGNSLEAFLDS